MISRFSPQLNLAQEGTAPDGTRWLLLTDEAQGIRLEFSPKQARDLRDLLDRWLSS